jgi:hypothetical protein
MQLQRRAGSIFICIKPSIANVFNKLPKIFQAYGVTAYNSTYAQYVYPELDASSSRAESNERTMGKSGLFPFANVFH